jgi:hypothetical protein
MLMRYEPKGYASSKNRNVAFGATLDIEFRQIMLYQSTFLQQF